MSDSNQRSFELSISLQVTSKRDAKLSHYASLLEDALVEALKEHPAITAYFVAADADSDEVRVGLRFEGMEAKYIEDTADEVLDAAISKASSADASAARQESTLVPA